MCGAAGFSEREERAVRDLLAHIAQRRPDRPSCSRLMLCPWDDVAEHRELAQDMEQLIR